jgi:hypothetical protein
VHWLLANGLLHFNQNLNTCKISGMCNQEFLSFSKDILRKTFGKRVPLILFTQDLLKFLGGTGRTIMFAAEKTFTEGKIKKNALRHWILIRDLNENNNGN